MQTSNTFLEERRNLQALYSRKTIDVQWTQQLIQPLQTSYGPGQEIRLVLQRSKHMVDLGKGIQLSFRPVIQFNQDSMPDIARKSFMCCTHVLASDYFNLAQVTLNGNAICAQSNISLSKPRNLFQNLYNSLISKKKYRIDGEDAVFSGTVFPSQYGSSNVGFSENSITHPNGQANAVTANTQPIINLQSSKFEADPYPRAIISKMWTYNQEFNLAPQNGPALNSNPYYSGYMTGNGHMPPTANFGGVPQNGALNGGEVAGTTYQSNFPLIGLMQTASTTQYMMVNERFQKMRMRFIVATTSCYSYANGPDGASAQNTPIQVSTTVPTGQLAVASSKALVLQDTCVQSTFASSAFAPADMTNLTQISQTSLVGAQFQTYGTSVQGPLGTGACVPSASNINRNRLGTPWTAQSSTFFPPETYTNLMVPLSDISIELDQIGTICCDSTQTIIQIQCSEANQVLSAYLQPSYFGKGGGVNNMLPTGISGEAGAISSDCQLFLQNCLIGSASYFLTDLVCRVEYQSYPDEAYPTIRQLLYQPIPYQSIRSQSEIINSTSGMNTLRLSIGGSALLNAIVLFIIPNFPAPLVNSGSVCRPQDCLIDYTGMNVPSLGDARAMPTLDSVYIPWTQLSVQVDNKIYEANPLIPINNPSYASYLKAQEGAFSVFGKYMPQDLKSWMTSRFAYVLAINPKNDREAMIVDQQVIVSCSFDDTIRRQQAQTMGTFNQTGNGNFWLQAVAVVSQSVVNCDYVKI